MCQQKQYAERSAVEEQNTEVYEEELDDEEELPDTLEQWQCRLILIHEEIIQIVLEILQCCDRISNTISIPSYWIATT